MDVQRKKGLLDVCVLAVLQRGPSYGYKIVRDVSACIAVSESTLYPILRRLEANGSVTTCTQEHNGRTRRYYQITGAGRARIQAFLDEWEEVKHIYAFIEGTLETSDAGVPEAQPEGGAGVPEAQPEGGAGVPKAERTAANENETAKAHSEDAAGLSDAEKKQTNKDETAETHPEGRHWTFRYRRNGGSI